MIAKTYIYNFSTFTFILLCLYTENDIVSFFYNCWMLTPYRNISDYLFNFLQVIYCYYTVSLYFYFINFFYLNKRKYMQSVCKVNVWNVI